MAGVAERSVWADGTRTIYLALLIIFKRGAKVKMTRELAATENNALFGLTPKCIIFAIIVVSAYWLVADDPSPLLVPIIGVGAYLAMGVYDNRYRCDPVFAERGPPSAITATSGVGVERQIYLMHAIFIAPLLIYVGLRGARSDSRALGVVLSMGILALVYHVGKFFAASINQ